MPDFDLSLVLRGRDDGASAAANKTATALDRLTSAEEKAALAAAQAKITADNLKASYSTQQAAITRLAAENSRLANAEANAAAKAALMSSTLRSSRVNLSNFGSQFQDITQSLTLGISPMTVFAQQAGQTAYSLTGLGGKAGAVARIFAGPFGSIIIATAAILGKLAFESENAAKKQEDLGDMADYVGRAQTQLGKVIDLVTGKFTSQNIVLREAIRLQAILAQQKAVKEGQEAGLSLGKARPDFSVGSWLRGEFKFPPADFQRAIGEFRTNANASFTDFRKSIEAMAKEGRLKGININEVLENALRVAAARGDVQANKDIQAVLEGGKLPDYLQKTAKAKKPKKEKKGPDPFGVEEFGRDAATRIRDIAAGFATIPPQVERVNKAMAQLDDLADDIAHKKPANMKELLADIEKAKGLIADSINRPFNEFILDQQRSLDIQRLVTRGRYDEADALAIIQKLERDQGPLDQAHKDAILASVQAIKAEQREADILREKQQKYLDLLGDVKDAVKGIISDPVKGLLDFPKRIISSLNNLRTEQVFDKLFGQAFRDLQDKITGNTVEKDAAERMAKAVNEAADANKRAEAAVNDLSDAARTAAGALRNINTPSGATPIGPNGVDPLAPLGPGGQGAIVVTGQRPTNLPTIFEKLAKGVGISDEAAKKIGSIGGKAFSGAATGALTNSILAPLGKALGFKTSAIGAQLGGAIGNFIPIPGGSIIGSVLGSLIGGLFQKTKAGSTTITNAFDKGSTSGNFKDVTSGLAGSVQGAVLQIAQQLGGQLGSFSVSIGKRKDQFVVDPTGGGRTKGGGTLKFSTEEEAVAAAILDAVRDGAVTGLSAAVQRALQSSSDVNKALSEALKVQQVEDLIGGLGGSLARMFKQFDQEAAERVRVARTYGLDVVAVEKINGEQRAKLVDDLLKQRLGSLQDLQKQIKYGDLFEGDASTRRATLLDQIGKTMKDAEDGVEGATDQLAQLYQQLISTSREAFGTAGPEYTTDRDLVTSGLDHIIEAERKRVQDAADYNNAALDAARRNNLLTGETNDLLARNNYLLGVLAGVGTSPGGGNDYSASTYRLSQFAAA